MVECAVNPPGIGPAFHRGLTRCFPAWGDESVTRWYFDRRAGGPAADRIVLREGSDLLAGCGVNYRQVRLASGAVVPSAVITSAWTRPEARGRGLFARVVEEAVARARRRRRGLVLAFVTADNASARGLARAGWALLPTRYLVTTDDTPEPAPGAAVTCAQAVMTAAIRDRLAALRQRAAAGSCHIVYPTAAAFASQMWRRPHPVRLLRLRGAWALVEETADTDRLLLAVGRLDRRRLLATLITRARHRGRKLFVYSNCDEVGATATALGLAAKPGFFGVRIAAAGRLVRALGLDRQSAASDSGALITPESPWYVGRWRVDGGDRL